MKYLIKGLAIIGLVSMSHVAVAIDNVSDGDILTAEGVNEVIDATNANTDSVNDIQDAVLTLEGGLDFDIISDTVPVPCATVYSVGDTGPAGGLVFLVTTDGCDGLEAWTEDEATDLSWGCLLTKTGAAGTAVGTGAPNTALIELAPCPAGAADSTRTASYGGESDWYLPSIDELIRMYTTIGPGGTNAGNFTTTVQYWSSTEVSVDRASVVEFANGGRPDVELKSFNNNVRAIRTFNQ